MRWSIRAGPLDHARPGVDGRGWMWELRRDKQTRRVFVEISGTALASSAGLAEDTRAAIATRGGSVIDQVLELHSPPEVIRCSTSGCDLLR